MSQNNLFSYEFQILAHSEKVIKSQIFKVEYSMPETIFREVNKLLAGESSIVSGIYEKGT